MAEQNVAQSATNSSVGDPLILNALVEMLRNGQGQKITMMVQEDSTMPTNTSIGMPKNISRTIPTTMPSTMPSNTSIIMPKNISRKTPTSMQSTGVEAHGIPAMSRTKTHMTRVGSSEKLHRRPSTSNTNVPNGLVESQMNAPIRSTPNVGTVRIFPPTLEQVSLRSNIDSQSRLLRILPDTPENNEIRQEMTKKIQLWEGALLETAGATSDKQEVNDQVTDVPVRGFTSTPKTTKVSLVTTKGLQELTILLTSEGNVLKDEKSLKYFHFIYRHAEILFGDTIQKDWRNQPKDKKEQLFNDVITTFGNPSFNRDVILDIACKYIHSKRDNLRLKLFKDLKYPRPAWITNQVTWDELVKDAKFKRKLKRKVDDNPNYKPTIEGSKRRLHDTIIATKARVSRIGSHKLGSGGYNSIRASMVHHFEKEAVEEDLKYALLHGSQGLRQYMIDRGDKLINSDQFDEAQKSNSSTQASGSEHEDEMHSYDAINVPETQKSAIIASQHMGEKNNDEDVQCNEHSEMTIHPVPHRKRSKRKQMVTHIS